MNLLQVIEEAAEVVLPPGVKPFVRLAYLAYETIDGKSYNVKATDLAKVAASETAAGEAAHKAAKLAGMREAIEPHVNRAIVGVTSSHASLDAIMAEIARRL